MRSQVDYHKHVAALRQRGDLTLQAYNLTCVLSCRTIADTPCTIQDAIQVHGGRNSTYKALRQLEDLGLITRQRKHGRAYFYACVSVQEPTLREESPRKYQPKHNNSPNKPQKSHGERKKRVSVTVPKTWANSLSEKQQEQLHTYSVQPHLREPVEKALAAIHPDQINGAILNSIRKAIDPIAYISKLVNSDGTFQPHCLAPKQPPESKKVEPKQPERAPQPPEEPRRKLTPEEKAKCKQTTDKWEARFKAMFEEPKKKSTARSNPSSKQSEPSSQPFSWTQRLTQNYGTD